VRNDKTVKFTNHTDDELSFPTLRLVVAAGADFEVSDPAAIESLKDQGFPVAGENPPSSEGE